jgi:hypothetical protein
MQKVRKVQKDIEMRDAIYRSSYTFFVKHCKDCLYPKCEKCFFLQGEIDGLRNVLIRH